MAKEDKEAGSDSDLLDAIEKATEADLEAIQARLKKCEAEANVFRMVVKILERRFFGKKARKSSAVSSTVNTSDDLVDRRKKVVAFLLASGPKSPQRISEGTGIAKHGPGSLSRVLDCDWFREESGIIYLTETGKARK